MGLLEHADKSALEVFGEPKPEETAADPEPPYAKLLQYARSCPHGITRTEAHAFFGNHRKAEELDADFALLTQNGLGCWQGNRWIAHRLTGGGVASTAGEAAKGEAEAGRRRL